jgi:diguanylate cyclase (GGDEF)-like protein
MNAKVLYRYTKKMHLLYVEDDKELIKQSVELFKMLFASVTVCEDGEKGLERYKLNQSFFDIVITDLNMPKMSGFEMIEEILLLNPNQTISVISGEDESGMLLRLINLGIDSFLLKPISEKQLLQTLYKMAYNIYNEKVALNYQEQIVESNVYLELEVEKRTQELKKQLYTDHLTGLKNRNALSYDFEKRDYTALAIIDIDHFRCINDLYGSTVGNEILKQFADILELHTCQFDYELYRTSGDEFFICSQEKNFSSFKEFLKSLSDFLIHLPLFIKKLDTEIYVDATIGISFEEKKLLSNANIALKFAKTNKKAFVIYKESMNTLEKMQNTLNWKRKIQYSLKNDNIIPVYQPIVNVKGKVIKYEALMRLRNIENGEEKLISPYFFLDIAIATKEYGRLSYQLISKALTQLKNSSSIISINLTYSDFIDSDIIQLLTDSLERSEIGTRLIFEIVESEDIKDYEIVKKFIGKFRKYGVKIAIDDFGSGFSNFTHIMQTQPDYIKIDGSLIKNIDKDRDTQILVKAIMRLANELNVKVIAEFVHSKEVFEKLMEYKIEEYQGFYFFEPSTTFVEDEDLEKI